eukprot:12399358-Alexandrium_andersonii.AAC.1
MTVVSSSGSRSLHTSMVGPRPRGPGCRRLIAPRYALQAVTRELQSLSRASTQEYKHEKCRQLSASPIDCSVSLLIHC